MVKNIHLYFNSFWAFYKQAQGSIDSKAEFRDSLTELENFIDSYAAEEETDDDEGKAGQWFLGNLRDELCIRNFRLLQGLW